MGLFSSIGKVVGKVLEPVGDIVGGVVSPILGLTEARNQRKHEKSEFDYEHWWQENLLNSAHQREANDLRLAGINPILTATGGNGAGSGSVSGHSTPMPDFSPISSARQIALQKAMQQEQFKEIASTVSKNEEEAKLLAEKRRQEVMNGDANRHYLSVMSDNSAAETRLRNIEADIRDLELPAMREKKKLENEWWNTSTAKDLYKAKLIAGDISQTLLGAPMQGINSGGMNPAFFVSKGAKVAGQMREVVREGNALYDVNTGEFVRNIGKKRK